MKILKKIAGILLIIGALILSLATLLSILRTIIDSTNEIKKSVSGGIGYLLGCLIVITLLVFLIYFMVKKGIKFLKKESLPEESIDDIGI